MHTQDFKTYIDHIRKEALHIGFSIKTMDGYLVIWNKYIAWKSENHFIIMKKNILNFY